MDMLRLRGLLSDRAEIKDQIAALEQELARIETAIGMEIVDAEAPVRIEGLGTVQITAPSRSTSFDPSALRELMQSLRETGHGEIADEIAGCVKTSERAGGLRFNAERTKRNDNQ